MTDLSIRVEILQWTPPVAVSLTIDSPEWSGFTFGLVLEAGGDIASFDVMRSAADAPLLTARLLQRVPFGRLERAALSEIRAVEAEWNRLNPDRPLYEPGELSETDERPRANRDDLRLANLAARYIETLGAPNQAEALAAWSQESPERGFYSATSISKMISRARQRDLLTRTTRGRAGGQLTPKALALLGRTPTSAWARATPEQKLQALRADRRRQQEDSTSNGGGS